MELDQEMNPEQPFDDAADRQNEAEEIRNAFLRGLLAAGSTHEIIAMASTVAPGGDVAPVADSEAVRAAQPVLEAPTDDHTHTTARILADCAMALERQTGWACCCYVEAWSHTNGSVEITYHVWIGRPTGGISTKGTTLTEAVDAALLQWRQATGKDVQP